MEWSIEYYSPEVEESILGLPEGLLSRYFRLTDLMIEFGSNLGMPHTKPIENGLFELVPVDDSLLSSVPLGVPFLIVYTFSLPILLVFHLSKTIRA
jgi:hypothetical protein